MIEITKVEGGIIYVSETARTIRPAAIDAVRKGISLSGANLSGADLSGADLSGADLSGADLSGADLSWADLSGADLSGADLSGADLHRANLSEADLSEANMLGANMSRAIGLGNWVIFGPIRSDGYHFMMSRTMPGEFRVWAGCRDFTLPEARKHWELTRPAGTTLGDETRRVLDYLEVEASARGWEEWQESDT